jgi:hypothetical protein
MIVWTAHVHAYFSIARVCWRMLTNADVWWRMVESCGACTLTRIRWRMLTYADVCWRMLTYTSPHTRRRWELRIVRTDAHTLTYADVYLSHVDVCWRIPLLTLGDDESCGACALTRIRWRMLTFADVCWRTPLLTLGDDESCRATLWERAPWRAQKESLIL